MGLLVDYEEPKHPAQVKLDHVNKLLALEAALKRDVPEEDQLTEEGTTTHWHCEGAYVREFFLPEGHVVTGEIHKYSCINILLQGKIKLVQSDGERIVEAPHIYIAQPYEKKALYALEDSIFLNVHATEETDPQKLREHFTVPPEQYIEQLTEETRKCLG